MNQITQWVRFTCSQCRKVLKSPATNAGQRCRCPQCLTPMMIPVQAGALTARPMVQPVRVRYPAVAPARREQGAVPFKIALPKNLGGMETTVSKGTANSMAKVVTGGFLVALGVVLTAILGIRTGRPSS
jgi:hypothetical protein